MLGKLEKMDAFFEARLDGYDEHMLRDIAGAREFYPYTAACLPERDGAQVLDLGIGTGLELGFYFSRNPAARVTGIDLSRAMLAAAARKFPGKALELVCASYFDAELGIGRYDAAVSVESLHHFTAEEKLPLYEKLCRAIRADGRFVLTDYFAESDEIERANFETLARLRREQGITDGGFYHYDTPLTLAHECELLRAAGFSRVTVAKTWGATATVLAERSCRDCRKSSV